MAGKSGEERLKEMEAEMALFEQEVLGAPVALPPGDAVPLPVPLAIPTVPAVAAVPVVPTVSALPVARPVIATNTYSQVQQSLDARAAAAAIVVGPMMVPPMPFVGPAIPPPRPPVMRPSFIPHALQRPLDPRPSFIPHVLQRAPGPRHPCMPPPQPLMSHPMHGPPPMMPPPPMAMRPGPPPPPVGPLPPPPPPRPVVQSSPKMNPSVIQAAPTVYTVPPVRKVEEEVPEIPPVADSKDLSYEETVIGPSMPEIEPVQPEVVPEPVQEDKKKSKPEKMKRCIRTAAGTNWEDASLLEWDNDDFRIFCGDLGNEVNDDILTRAFSRYPSFLKAKVIRDKRTGKTKGYGFVSFKDPNDYVRAMREMNGKYVGSRPIKLRKSMWKDRNIDVVRKKQKERKKLGLR
ncbi:PREDICTED: RNA-binding protein 42 [Nanorana parkeri]|uniref:RNA-binding protein 42 n=1 Tax=Nanorana parkeri TaxID=125878 RepID=UPI000854A51E|nr:PREDICTED: RNA-binding protein 42 [Nanorana parkeri]